MDFLKAEIANKRKALQDEGSTRSPKYMRRGEAERLKEQTTERNVDVASRSIARLSPVPSAPSGSRAVSVDRSEEAPDPPSSSNAKSESYNISNEDAVRRLRAKGQPVRLFAESDRDRRLRLRALELLEERGTDKGSGLNDFRRVMEHMEQGLNVEDAVKRLVVQDQNDKDKDKSRGSSDEKQSSEEEVLDLDLVKSDPDKLYPLIYYAIKRKLKEWEQSMIERPDHIKHSTQGKRAAATQVQSGEYLKPLFKTLRSRNLPGDMLARLAEIVHYMQKRQYQRANDSYLRLSIGNAPWPIGVTMVGIHERSAREKISSDQVAHVLNDEVSRKYIQSLKRLLTFAQTKYPPNDVSQLMG